MSLLGLVRIVVSDKNNKIENWYRSALYFYAKVTGWVITPLLLAIILNKYTGGDSILFFIFMVLSFVVTIYGIYREIRVYKKDLEINDRNRN